MNGKYEIGDFVLTNWKLTKLIGCGSYGRVFEAEREEYGEKYYSAIKIITIPQSEDEVKSIQSEGLTEEGVTEYFGGIVKQIIAECTFMNQVKGVTNIVGYEDHVVLPHEGKMGWYVIIRMELLTPLLDAISQKPLTLRDTAKLGVDMCKALEVCGKLNIIHRDVKPENIMVSSLGDYKLGDFGVSATMGKTLGVFSRKGTESYMAPEVVKGEKYDATVDIYSLGIVLYRFLNENRFPFLPKAPATINYADKVSALERMHAGEPIPAPVNADAELSRIVLKACAYDAGDRYQTPEQMRRDLERWLGIGSDIVSDTLPVETKWEKTAIRRDVPKWLVPTICAGAALVIGLIVLIAADPLGLRGKESEKAKESEQMEVAASRDHVKEPDMKEEISEVVPSKSSELEEALGMSEDAVVENLSESEEQAGEQTEEPSEEPSEEQSKELETAEEMTRMGNKYYSGEGVEQDYKEAFEWYSKAAKAGDAFAMYRLGIMYLNNEGVSEKNEDTRLWRARQWLDKAVEAGCSEAMNKLGVMYFHGDGVKLDYKQSVRYFRMAAEADNVYGINNLGLMYEQGNGVGQDYEQAIYWYGKAAEMGLADAMNNMGRMYGLGTGVKQDYKQAEEWYVRAAEAGSSYAMNNLAVLYERGYGVEKDAEKAAYWREKAKEARGE